MSEEGISKSSWFRLYRSFLEWEWYTNEHTKTVFLHCLLKANWGIGRFQGVVIPAGSFATSYQNMAKETGLTVDMVRTAIKHLKRTGEITSQAYHDFSVITVVRWKEFQDDSQADYQASPKQVPSKSQQYKKNKNNKKNIYSAPADQRVYDYDALQKRLSQ